MCSFKKLTAKIAIFASFVALSHLSMAEDYRNYGGAYQDFGGGSTNSEWSSLPSASNNPWNDLNQTENNPNIGETGTPTTHINNSKRDMIPTKKCDGCRAIEK